MNKTFPYLLCLLLLLASCDVFNLQKKEDPKGKPIASVYNVHLYKEDVKGLIPKGIAPKDSIVLLKSIVNTWAKQQLLLKKAEENVTQDQNKSYVTLVKNYKESLLINGYKEKLIKQQLDTVIKEEDIQKYYDLNRSNFRLKEDVLQMKFLHFGNDFLDKKEVIKKFKSEKEEDLETLESLVINFKSYRLRDSTWLTLDKVLLKIPPFQKEPKEKLLKISKFIQKEDSLGVYLVAINGILRRNDIAPLSYITPTIKQMILHKRKLELIREIEKTLINDAIQNKHFKEY